MDLSSKPINPIVHASKERDYLNLAEYKCVFCLSVSLSVCFFVCLLAVIVDNPWIPIQTLFEHKRSFFVSVTFDGKIMMRLAGD